VLCQEIGKINKIIISQVFIIELVFLKSCFTLPWLLRIVRLRVIYALPEAFAVLVFKIAHYMLINVIEFVKQCLKVQIRLHLIMKFNFKLSWFPVTINHNTPTVNSFSRKSTVIYSDFKFVSRKILFNEPFYSINTTVLTVVVSLGV